jgi:hypothetical protein
MSQPKTKANIVGKLQTERKRLDQNLARLSREAMLQPGVIGASSVKDILAHLADWEAHMPLWLEAARGGDPVAEIESRGHARGGNAGARPVRLHWEGGGL